MSVSLKEAETIPEEVEEVTAVIVEDEPEDKKLAESELARAGVDAVSFDTLEDFNKVREAAKEAKIISLDLDVDNVTYRSVELAEELVGENPFRGIFIFTKRPRSVQNLPVNFVVEKRTQAQGLYGLISFQILIHDTSLSLLRLMDNLLNRTSHAHIGPVFDRFYGELQEFYSVLPFVINKSAMLDPEMSTDCQEIEFLLRPLLSDHLHGATDYSTPSLLSFCQPLFQGVSNTLRRFENIEGVHFNPTLRREVDALEAALAAHEVSLEAAASVEAHGLVSAPADSEAEGDAALYLNIRFPKCSKEKPLLPVGQQTELVVNIGAPIDSESAGQTDSIPNEEASETGKIDHVDVIVLCAGADVVPLRNRLYLPPKKSNTAKFYITPLRQGNLSLSVVLLLRNDPIHRTTFNIQAE